MANYIRTTFLACYLHVSLVVFRILNIMATVGARLLLEGEGLVTGTGDFVNVLISNSGNGHASEKRFARGITVADLKVY